MKLYIRTKDERKALGYPTRRPAKAPARFAIDVKLEDTVADVKKNIETVQGTDVYPAAKQELLHRGKVLEDATTLEEIGVRENSFIVLRLSKNVDRSKRKLLVKTGKGRIFEIDVKLEDTGADVKKNIETVKGTDVYPAAQQKLLYRGKVLEDGTTLEEIGVGENSFIFLTLSKSKNSAGEASTAAAAPKGFPEAAEVPPVAGVPPVPAVNPPVQAPQATRPAAASPMGRSNRKQKKKVTTEKYGGKTTTQQHERSLLHVEIQDLLTEALRSSNHLLQDEVAITKRLEGDLRKHGDYICISIMRACEILRSKDPNIFKKRGPRSIAQGIIDSFPKSEIIEGLTKHDVGFLTFRINGGWMARHIHKMLQDGIALWAPIARVKTAIVDSPILYDVADVRSGFITNMFVRTLEYCGVQVAGRMINTKSVDQVKSYVPDKHGYELIRSKLEPGHPRTLGKEEASYQPQLSNVHADLAALWCGIHEQKVEWIIYVTPVQQRGYIETCFTAAKEFPCEDPPIMHYMGYEPSMLNESEKHNFLMEFMDDHRVTSIVEQGVWYDGRRRYSGEDILDCALRYACLRTPTYVGSTLTLNLDEMLNKEGNTFVYLLAARSAVGVSCRRDMFISKKALVGRERDLGLHLLQFSEIIEMSFRTMKPHLVCEYLWSLSKNITSYCLEVRSSERNFLLCRAAGVVMDKCFDLLGLIPMSSKHQISEETARRDAIRDFYISLPNVRPNLTSRFEMVSMFVEVSHPSFENGNLFGDIMLSDTYGLRPDGWCKVDKEVCGHVSYFSNNWYNSEGISNPSFLPLGSPSSYHTVPFSYTIKIGICLWVTSEKKDSCYQLCVCNRPLDLSEFWKGDQSIKRGTFSVEGENGVVRILYVCLKEALDTSFKLSYEPIDGHRPRVRGRILAYYGGDYLDNCIGYDKELYKALVFEIDSTKLEKCEALALKKFSMAVPTNGVLVFDASLEDVDSGEIIVNGTHEFHEKDEGKDSKWIMKGKTCCFTLTVDWIRGVGCS